MAKSRIKDLEDKYLACDPLPQPDDEKDLNCFITLWKEQKEKELDVTVQNCQTAENVCGNIKQMLAEALTQYDYKAAQQCHAFMEMLVRSFTLF